MNLTIRTEDVLSAYNGKVGCMCGCNGDYAYNEAKKDEGTKDRGYEVQDDELSDRKVKTRINRLLKLVEQKDYDDLDINLNGDTKYIYLAKNNRCICLYLAN